MKQPPPTIRQFGLSPLAKAGVLVRSLQDRGSEAEHTVTAPHRDAHCLLLLATHGRFTLHLDFEEVAFAAPALLLVFPERVHQVLDMQEPQGWGLSFDPVLLDSELLPVLDQGFAAPLLPDPQAAFYQQAVTLLELLAQLQAGGSDAYTGRTTHALLNALFNLLAGKAAVMAATKPRESRAVLLGQGFSQLLKRQYKTWKQPARYAAELAVSVAHLNDTVKALTGASLSAHIQRRAILEAKRLLYFTDLSVKEIGYAVGYDEPVYFGKLFKKVAGVTPRRFRRQFRD